MRIFVAGHKGMVGSAICRRLATQGRDVVTRGRAELDLTRQEDVHRFMQAEKPDRVIVAAAKVGGILANNSYPAEFIRENLEIETNLVHEAWRAGVERVLFLGSSCVYPRNAPQPIREEALLTGPLESTNEPYAIAKIAGIKLCESYNRQYGTDFRSVMPTNLYGPGDNFHPDNSHVLPALLRRFDEAVRHDGGEVTIWGTGTPRREFLYVDELADAAVFVMDLPRDIYEAHVDPMCSHINVGVGKDISIAELAGLIADVTGFRGRISFDASKPDGVARKLVDIGKIAGLGWRPSIGLKDGLAETYRWFLDHHAEARGVSA